MIFFTSDWHLNEKRIGEFNPYFRSFNSVDEQNRTILTLVNEIIGVNDTLYHLGDVAVDTDGVELLKHVKCKKRFLIMGNYDEDKVKELESYFDEISLERIIELRGQVFYLNHYPKNRSKTYFNLTGHVHGLWKVQRDSINVGVDAWHFRPLSEETILFTKNAVENFYDENVFYC